MLNKANIVLILCTLVCLSTSVRIQAQEGIYTIDVSQSEIRFKVSHMGAFKVKGFFSEFSGWFNFENDRLTSIESMVSAASVDTDNLERDDILVNEAYFNVEEFPNMTFKAKTFSIEEGENIMTGLLKIKDTENNIRFPYQLTFDKGLNTVTLIAETRIKRKDFNLIFGSMNGLIGNNVNIQLLIVGTK